MKILIKPLSFLFIGVILVWLILFLSFFNHPVMLGLAVIAFSLGLRHGFDADHIAAIDNVTRKMLHDGKMPLTVGIFFALGHSSVVFILTGFVVIGSISLEHNASALSIGGFIGTFVSVSFLWLTAFFNLSSFYKTAVNKPEKAQNSDLKLGFFSRIFYRYFSLVNKSWKMLIVGFLFGLGFDTATEIALLGISATQVLNGASIYNVMLLPVAFASGMCIVDALDGWMIMSLCNWAKANKKGKFYYNLFITATLTIVSFAIGAFEAVNYFNQNQVNVNWFNNLADTVSNNSELIGVSIVILFIMSWAFMRFAYRGRRMSRS